MAASEHGRLSVSLVDVAEGQEGEFQALVRTFESIFERKGYGRVETFRDEANPARFYAVRHWSSAAAAEQCHGDVEVQALTSTLYKIARVTHIVNGARRPDPLRMTMDDRRMRYEPDRRTGFDRRVADKGREAGNRRSGDDRRLGPRRLREHPGEISLIAAARRAREHADAAFSHVRVGAALETADGSIITGCNVENASYGLSMCAERVAMFKAISEGHRAFIRIAVVADGDHQMPPCGACRQILWEFGGNLEVQLANLNTVLGIHRLAELLPLPFDARLL